jgi:hypothetical protein
LFLPVYPEPLVLHDFALASKMMNMEQFLAAAQEQGVMARDEAEQWQRELKAADAEGWFTFAGDDVCSCGEGISDLSDDLIIDLLVMLLTDNNSIKAIHRFSQMTDILIEEVTIAQEVPEKEVEIQFFQILIEISTSIMHCRCPIFTPSITRDNVSSSND